MSENTDQSKQESLPDAPSARRRKLSQAGLVAAASPRWVMPTVAAVLLPSHATATPTSNTPNPEPNPEPNPDVPNGDPNVPPEEDEPTEPQPLCTDLQAYTQTFSYDQPPNNMDDGSSWMLITDHTLPTPQCSPPAITITALAQVTSLDLTSNIRTTVLWIDLVQPVSAPIAYSNTANQNFPTLPIGWDADGLFLGGSATFADADGNTWEVAYVSHTDDTVTLRIAPL